MITCEEIGNNNQKNLILILKINVLFFNYETVTFFLNNFNQFFYT